MTEFSDRDIALMASWTKLREAKGISLDDIVQRTNIHLAKLKAIEAHEFDALGTETFALGYIRSYAKALDENSDVFVQVYKDAMTSELPVKAEAAKSSTNGSDHDTSPSALLAAVKKINVLYLSVAFIVIWIVVMLVLPGESTSQSAVNASGNEAPTSAEPVTTDNPTSLETSLSSDSAAAETVVSDLAVEEPARGESEVSVSDDAREETSSTENTDTVEDILVLSFSDECWLEISDATGRVLIAELQEKGDNQRLFGQAPFKVKLGNARVVTLTLNGEVVSIEPKPGRKTLRFTVPR